MNTNMTDVDVFQKSLCHCALDDSSLSILKVKMLSLKYRGLFEVLHTCNGCHATSYRHHG